MDVRAAIEELQNLGLTRYEATCYIVLARLGSADPRKVGSEAGIPYPNAYEALRRLANKGWAELVKKKPKTYRARKPESVRDRRWRRTLMRPSASCPRSTTPRLLRKRSWSTRSAGREKVLSKIREMIDGAKETLVLVSPTMGLDKGVISLLEAALKRGVRVRAILDEEGANAASLPREVETRTGNLVAVDVLVDDKAALISLPDYSACGWVDSPQVAGHFKQFLELMWNNSRATGG